MEPLATVESLEQYLLKMVSLWQGRGEISILCCGFSPLGK